MSGIDIIVTEFIGGVSIGTANSKLLSTHIFWGAGESIVGDLNIELPLQFVMGIEC